MSPSFAQRNTAELCNRLGTWNARGKMGLQRERKWVDAFRKGKLELVALNKRKL